MKVMRKRAVKNICVVLALLAVVSMMFMSRGFALRAAVFPYSPVSALTMHAQFDRSEGGVDLYRITTNVPIERATDSALTTWVIYKVGPFHFADCCRGAQQ